MLHHIILKTLLVALLAVLTTATRPSPEYRTAQGLRYTKSNIVQSKPRIIGSARERQLPSLMKMSELRPFAIDVLTEMINTAAAEGIRPPTGLSFYRNKYWQFVIAPVGAGDHGEYNVQTICTEQDQLPFDGGVMLTFGMNGNDPHNGFWMDACGRDKRDCARLLHDNGGIADAKTMVRLYENTVNNHRSPEEIQAADKYF